MWHDKALGALVLGAAVACAAQAADLRQATGPAADTIPAEAGIKDAIARYGPDAAYIPLALNFLCGREPVPSVSTSCERHITRPIRIYGVAGHMHLRGVDIELELNPGTPSAQVLLHIPRWNFHWQDVYYLEQPIDL